jgi:elongation factor G
MTTIRPTHWRNFGIIAHIDAGKTTLTERLLLATGVIHRTGEVHDGNATTDHMAIEQERGITIGAAAIQCAWTPTNGQTYRLTLIDTPGHVDFAIEVERSLRVLDGAVAVFCGVAGVQPQSETVWRQANRHGVPRLAFINKMDRPGANYQAVLEQMKERLDAPVAAISVPDLNEDGTVRGVAHLVGRTYQSWNEHGETAPESWTSEQAARFESLRATMVEAVANLDEQLADDYLAGESIEAAALDRAIRRATLAGVLVPALPGSAFKNRGISSLLNAASAFLPSPLDRPEVKAVGPEGEETVSQQATAPVAALVFKLVHQEHGSLAFIRLYGGTLRAGDVLVNSRTHQNVRVGRLAVIMAERTREVEQAQAGEIVAISGLKDVATGDTLSPSEHRLTLETIQAQPAVLAWRLTPKENRDLIRLGAGLARLAQEDPSFRVGVDPDTGETLVWGMGELHLEVMVERLRRESQVDVVVGSPRVAYQETPSQSVESAIGLVDKQTGGRGQYAQLVIDVAPRQDGQIVIEHQVVGGAVSRNFLMAAEKGMRDALGEGPRGYPVVGLTLVIKDGKTHAVDSSEMAFIRAGALAVTAALNQAGTTQLEPVMLVSVDTPSASIGDVLGDLQRRGGQVQRLEDKGTRSEVEVLAPLAALDGYSTALRSLTQGRASAQMAFARYQPAMDRRPNAKVSM